MTNTSLRLDIVAVSDNKVPRKARKKNVNSETVADLTAIFGVNFG